MIGKKRYARALQLQGGIHTYSIFGTCCQVWSKDFCDRRYHVSPIATEGLSPPKQSYKPPPNGSMNHYKSVVFITFQNVKTPELTKSPPVKIFWRRLCITSQRDLHPGTNNKKDCITCSQHCAYKQESFSFICYHTFFSLGRVAGTETLEDLQIPHTFRLIRKKWTG